MSSLTRASKLQAKEEFQKIISNFLLPVFSVAPQINWGSGEKSVNKLIRKTDSEIIFYPSHTPSFSIVVSLKDAEKVSQRIDIADKILQELLLVSAVRFTKEREFISITKNKRKDREQYYRDTVYEAAIELGICSYLGGFPIYELLKKLEDWALKTYEGHKVSFCFLVNTTQEAISPKVSFMRFLESNHSAVFTDGITSSIKLDKNGNIIDFISTQAQNDDEKRKPYAPYRFQDICRECDGDTIGVVLQSNGDILIFKKKELFCVRMNGQWKILNFDNIVHTLLEFLNAATTTKKNLVFAKEIFLSVLDASFSRTGACLAIVLQDKELEAETLYKKDRFKQETLPEDQEDCLSTREERERNKKIRVLQRLVHSCAKKNFYELDRKLRQELMALDGATVIDVAGNVLAVGAIVQVEGGSEGGGRLAATRALSKYGLAIKVSMDGKISAYKFDKEIFTVF